MLVKQAVNDIVCGKKVCFSDIPRGDIYLWFLTT